MTHLTDGIRGSRSTATLAAPRAREHARRAAKRAAARPTRCVSVCCRSPRRRPSPSRRRSSGIASVARTSGTTIALSRSSPRWFGWLRAGRAWPAAAALATLVLVLQAIWRAMPTPTNRPIVAGRLQRLRHRRHFRPQAQLTPTLTMTSTPTRPGRSCARWRTMSRGIEARDAGISARPGSAERIALQLTAAERKELARLLENELRRSGSIADAISMAHTDGALRCCCCQRRPDGRGDQAASGERRRRSGSRSCRSRQPRPAMCCPPASWSTCSTRMRSSRPSRR